MKKYLVQLKNPKTECYVLVNTKLGNIIKHHPCKNTPYKNVRIVNKDE